MQYILTQEEFDKHKADAARIISKMANDLQTACTLIANKVPIKDPWAPNIPDHPWGCILTQTAGNEWYCDHCPARKLCPHPNKNFSK